MLDQAPVPGDGPAVDDQRPVAVTGPGGRLGRALVAALTAAGRPVIGWGRPALELDDPGSAARLVDRDGPGLVLHAAAWTDVDGCARRPDLAMRRNADAVDALARACRRAGTGLLVVSTNEVFDGERRDGLGYREGDATGPRNPYGASKLAGEDAARAAWGQAPGLWVVRTAWLFGPPGNDFPDRITAAADRLPATDALPVVADEHGSPTSTTDLAAAILALLGRTGGGLWHLVDRGAASRLDWARLVLATRRPGRSVVPVPRSAFVRASDPPPWGVLDASAAAALGIRMRPWQDAAADDLALRAR